MSDISNSNGNDKLARFREDGLDWMGSLPDSWDVVRLKYLVNLTKAKSSEYDAFIGLENVESWTGRYIPSPQSIYDDPEDDIDGEEDPATDTKDSDDEDEEQKELLEVKEGDVLFSKLRPYLAKCMISPIDATCSSEFLVFRDFEGDKRFLKYVMLSSNFINMVNSSTYGTKMPRSSWDFIKNLPFPVVEFNEQTKIADYLDIQTTSIDCNIDKLNQLVNSLKEYRSSQISFYTINGVNTSNYSDSSLDWTSFTQMPLGWKTEKIKFASQTSMAKTDSFNNYIGLENVESVTGNYIDSSANVSIDNCLEVKKGDLLFGKLRPYLSKTIISPMDGACSSEFINFRKFNGDMRYLRYILVSQDFVNYVSSSTYGTKMPRTSWDFIKEIKIPIPSHKEQSCIADFLDSKCCNINNLISKIECMITLLSKNRDLIVFNCISGQFKMQGR